MSFVQNDVYEMKEKIPLKQNCLTDITAQIEWTLHAPRATQYDFWSLGGDAPFFLNYSMCFGNSSCSINL